MEDSNPAHSMLFSVLLSSDRQYCRSVLSHRISNKHGLSQMEISTSLVSNPANKQSPETIPSAFEPNHLLKISIPSRYSPCNRTSSKTFPYQGFRQILFSCVLLQFSQRSVPQQQQASMEGVLHVIEYLLLRRITSFLFQRT